MSSINNKKNVFTKEGFEKLQKELEYLKTTVREEIAKRLNEAASYGDLSENAAYAAAMEARDVNESRIAELEEILNNAVILEDEEVKKGVINIGSKVKIKNMTTSEITAFEIVGAGEVDLSLNKYSIDSPLVSLLLGKKVGDEIEYNSPAGILRYKIISID